MPEMADARYSIPSELATELIDQAIATSTPPKATTMRDEPVDEPALYRNQPGLRNDENAECHLDGSGAPVIFLIDRIDEQRPAVLQVGDHHHADDAGDKLAPPRAFGSQYLRFECVSPCGHFFLPGRSSNPDARVSLRYYWRRQARRTRSSTYVL